MHEEQLTSLRELIPEPAEVVLLIGSGISIPAPSSMPSWKSATQKALESDVTRTLPEGGRAYAREEFESGNYYEVFRLLREKSTAAVFQQLVANVFSDQGRQPNQLHQAVASSGVCGVVTTNFDRFIETAYVQSGHPTPAVITYCEEQKLKQLLSRMDNFFVVKLHGGIQYPGSMVLTAQQCRAVADAKLIQDLFRQIVNNHQLLVLGYGAGDPDFWELWRSALSDLYLRRPAIICVASDWEAITSHDFREDNIHVLEFDNSEDNYSFVAPVLEQLAGSAVPAEGRVVPSGIALAESTADKYVYLYCQLTEDHDSRLTSFISALCVGELLDSATQDGTMPVEQIRGRVRRQLGVSGARIQDDFLIAMRSLTTRGLVEVVEDRARLVPAWKRRLKQYHDALREIEEVILQSALERTSTDESVGSGHVAHLRTLLGHVLMWLGTDLAEQVLFLRFPSAGDRARVREVVEEFCDQESLDAEWYVRATERVLTPDTTEAEDWLSEKLRAQFLTSAYVMHPTSEALLKEYASRHVLYLGSSIALPLLAPHHPLHRPYNTLLRHSLRLGVELRVSREMLGEVKGHLRNAIKQYQQIEGEYLRQNLEAYIELTGELNGNVFLEGYLNCLRDGEPQSWGDYIHHLCQVRGGQLIPERGQIAEYAEEYLSIRPDLAKTDTGDAGELDRLTREILELRSRRRLRGGGAAWQLSLNEARQFLRVHRERALKANGEHLIWFLTTDARLAKLQQLEAERYPFPIGYTPHNWGQYINILDFDHRSSQHFARLLRRTEYGLVTGDVAIGLVKRLSDRLRDARVAAAEARIQDLVRSFFRDYHLRQAIRDSTRKEAVGLPPDEGSIQQMEEALDAFVIKARDDWESLKGDLERERESTTSLSRELESLQRIAKRKDYHISVLRGELKKLRE